MTTGEASGAGRRSEALAGLRREYDAALLESDLADDPLTQFRTWFDLVATSGLVEPNAMVLATADATGQPSARTVLLKEVDSDGFVFFTGYTSRKGRELTENPRASLVFPWFAVHRQVVVVGPVERVDRAATEEYFASRPHSSQLGAWASEQSTVLASRSQLDERYAQAAAEFPGEVPTPQRWGGFRLLPETVEFWAGRASRLHDRLRYRRATDASGWIVERLSP